MARSARQRFQWTARDVARYVGVTLVILAMLEGLARSAIALADRGLSHPYEQGMSAAYGKEPSVESGWQREYLKEYFASEEATWHSYVYWRRKPFRGKHINIDEHGLRRTWNATADPVHGQVRIFMFGGSTMWGVGARDDWTIPSLVSKRLAKHYAAGAWVTNFGEAGYVSTQEVVALIRELQRGRVPDVVVFLDGVNETLSALHNGVAGLPLNESNRVVEFNSRDHLNWQGGLLRQLGLYQIARRVVERSGMKSHRPYAGEAEARIGSLADNVVAAYIGNVRIVRALGAQFGFRVLFFWQPTVFSKPQLSEWERKVKYSSRWTQSGPLFARVYGRFAAEMRGGSVNDVANLSNLFGQDAATVFIDGAHMTEAGNDRIAEAIGQAVKDLRRAEPRALGDSGKR